MNLRFKALCGAATITVMGLAALPGTGQAADFHTICSAAGIPSTTIPVSLGPLGGASITTCDAVALGNDTCSTTPVPYNITVPGVIAAKGQLCPSII